MEEDRNWKVSTRIVRVRGKSWNGHEVGILICTFHCFKFKVTSALPLM
jgi:hypothetical protein